MDNAQKAIMIGVGLFITIIIISVVLLITNMGTGIADDARTKLSGVSDSMKQQLALAYDDKDDLTDKEVIACATMYGGQDGVTITVEGDTVTTGSAAQTKCGANKKFTGEVTVNNDNTVTIAFAHN